MSKKRKLIDEGRVFQDKWKADHFFVLWNENRVFQDKWKADNFFVLWNEKPMCLICSDIIATLKE